MSKVRYVPNRAGLDGLLRDGKTQDLVRQHAEAVRNRAGDGFVTSYMQGKSRYRAIIYADTWSAKHREARENVMVRSLG